MKAKLIFQPIRVAVTGSQVSPPLFESIELMKRSDCCRFASTTPYLRFLVTNSYEISDDAPSLIDLNHGEGASATQNESEASTTFNNRDEIVALSSWCTAPSGSGCNRCLSACPHEAITLNDQVLNKMKLSALAAAFAQAFAMLLPGAASPLKT